MAQQKNELGKGNMIAMVIGVALLGLLILLWLLV